MLVGALSRARVRGQAGFRTVLFLPQVIPLVVVAVIWRMIYAPDGPLNRALEAIGLGSLARPWLGDFTWALPAIGFVGTWVMSGLALVLFMAGVQKIPQSLYDAARVDGAGPLREFFAVTLPNLRGEIAVALTLTTIAALRNFDLVYITTQGGPGNSTSVPAFQVYNRAFQIGQIGSAAAIGFTLACVIFVLAFAITRIADRGTDVIARREQVLNYAILIVFSLVALYPVLGILSTALERARRHGGLPPPVEPPLLELLGRVDAGPLLVVPALERDRRGERRRDLDRALDPLRLRVRADALPRRDRALLRLPARADGPRGGADRAALLRPARPRT